MSIKPPSPILANMDTSREISHQQIKSPMAGKREYNRKKYYSAIKTGFMHMNNNEEERQSFLRPPIEAAITMMLPMVGQAATNDGD